MIIGFLVQAFAHVRVPVEMIVTQFLTLDRVTGTCREILSFCHQRMWINLWCGLKVKNRLNSTIFILSIGIHTDILPSQVSFGWPSKGLCHVLK